MAQNLINDLNGFSPDVQDIFDFRRQVSRLQSSKLLHPIFKRFDGIQFLNPEVTDSHFNGANF
ncbi:MAG: hypothetical protein IGR76_07140 [Synechococcales cyanobacterium T60_A2020_003]|nr:hypothetical protein [Synechococcales cyanobacterium T60_A2020_003]